MVIKHTPGAFHGTGLEALLEELEVTEVAIGGFMTHMCCESTAREAAARGMRVLVLEDATATRDVKAPDGTTIPHHQLHRMSLAALGDGLARIVTAQELMGGAS